MPSRVAGRPRAADGAAPDAGPALGRSAGRLGPAGAWLVPAALTALAAALRFHRLGWPARRYFDEVHYVADALALLENGVQEGFSVHPPLAQWLIGAGIAVVGDDPAGWRAAAALAGAATVLVTYLAALRLFRRRGVAALAALLVAVDGLAFTMSRIAMLDGFVALGVVTAFWLLLVDRDRMWHPAPPRPDGSPAPHPPPRPRAWRWLAAAVLGATVAVKWSGVLALAAAVPVVLAGELAFRRRTTGRALAGWPRLALHLVVLFGVVPAAVYVASYAGWFANYDETRPGRDRCPEQSEPCEVPLPERVADWAGEQAETWRFHTTLTEEHPYRSRALGWPVLHRPVAYAYEHCTAERRAELAREDRDCPVADDHVMHVLGLGNPVLWWLALPALLVLAWSGLRRRDWRAGMIAAFWLAQYVPWLAQTRPTLFLFYMTPVVPFMALGLAHAVWRSLGVRELRWWVGPLIAVLAVAAFVYWYPVLAGEELTWEAWRQRMWLQSWI
jgi:dolichyl-phosphate-mannose--protein O-mannosyl transferase